ncbi:MAG: transcriptional regulator [Candidatus Latescibacterota bacterium]
MRYNELSWKQIQSLRALDRTVHEPARLMVLSILALFGSAEFMYLMRQTGLTRGNLSSHMTRLEEAGYITVEKKFVNRIPKTLLRLTGAGREALADYRGRMRDFLAE